VFTVALIGPDGAGKTTVGRRLLEGLTLPAKYLYMGVNSDSSNRMLPTTSIIRAIKRACGAKPDVRGPQEMRPPSTQKRGLVRTLASEAKSMLSLANKVSEEWYRQLLAWSYQWRGYIVVYDRHYFVDYYAYDIAQCEWRRPLARRIHGFLLNHVYPKPDLVIYLDAPSEVLFARKGEGTIETLERRRKDYLDLRNHVPHFAVIDANRPADDVARDVADTIVDFHRARKQARSNSRKFSWQFESSKLQPASATTEQKS
jgi:thymidylate kinase